MPAYRVVALGLILVIGFTLLLPATVSGANLIGQALKIFGIGYVITQFGGQINTFINNLVGQRGVKWDGTTKVVPILSIGRGGYVGAAQVVGPPSMVSRVKAVGQIEARIGGIQGRMMVPVSTTDPTKLSKVEGVGLSALIDFKI